VSGLDQDGCAAPSSGCIEAMGSAPGLDDERRLSALAELWLQHAASLEEGDQDARLQAWMEAVRHAYAYLFFTGRTPGERAFEDRQTQVRDWYNYAVQEASTLLFEETMLGQPGAEASLERHMRRAGWTFHVDLDNVRLPEGTGPPEELLSAASLNFTGLRSIWRRDGFGAELVAVLDDPARTRAPQPEPEEAGERRRRRPQPPAWSEMPSPGITVLFRFDDDHLDEMMSTQTVRVE